MGAFEEAKGKVKEAAGDVIGDPDLQREGEAQREEQEAHTKAKAEEMRQDAAEESK